MIKGMTGYGTAQLSSGKASGVVEIKSVNHRFLDIAYYLPIGFGSAENKIRQILNKKIERGRITVSVKILKKPEPIITFNRQTAKNYMTYAKSIKRDLKLKGDISISDVMRLSGVVETKEVFVTVDSVWKAVDKGIRLSLNSLMTMKAREGRSIAADISKHLKHMLLQTKKIKSREKMILKKKMREFVEEEFVSFQKSNDINEELARLIHHIDEIKYLLKANVAVGKKIDFIAQEMQRETNTIGSKLQDKIVSKAVISLKSKIEKIREQAQNIE